MLEIFSERIDNLKHLLLYSVLIKPPPAAFFSDKKILLKDLLYVITISLYTCIYITNENNLISDNFVRQSKKQREQLINSKAVP